MLMFVETIDKFSEEVVGYKTIKGDEYLLNLDSLGISLIDDKSQIEILYMSITRFEFFGFVVFVVVVAYI